MGCWDYYAEVDAKPRERALQACMDIDLRPRTMEEPERERVPINELLEGLRTLYKILPIPVTR